MARGISVQDVLDHIEKGTYTYTIPHSDGVNGIVESEFVYIPGFKTAGFPASMIAKGFKNDVILGNVSIAKYPMSHPLATETSKGGVDGANWGSPYAAVSKARKCAWTYVDFDEAKIACEKMDVNNSVAGVTTGAGGANYLIDTGWQSKLIGKKIEIVIGAVTYYRRITTIDGPADKIIFWPDLPGGVTVGLGDAYTVKRFSLWDPYDWATVKYITAMHYAVNGMPYPKGNNDYGKDISDADAIQNYGMPDPDYDDAANTICKTLTGTGPLSWSHNGQINGIRGLNGGVWEWCLCQLGNVVDYVIDAGYMGEGYTLPTTTDRDWATMETAGACGIGDLAMVKTVAVGGDPDFDNAHYWVATGLRAFFVGGSFNNGARAAVSTLHTDSAPSGRNVFFGFRGAL